MMRNICSGLRISSDYLNVIIKRKAGHSKWQNIRHIKAAKDAERAAIFTKLSRQMKIACQEGGTVDPKFNLRLEQVIDQARRCNMPAATVQSVLKSCQTDKSQCKSYMIEIKGPGSCFIMCEVFTSALHHLKQNMATILRKHSSRFSDGGGIHSFEEKGIVEVEIDTTKDKVVVLEEATTHAIDVGAEDVSPIDENYLEFVCGKSNLRSVTIGLEKYKYNIISASVEYIPVKLQNISEDDLKICMSLQEKLQNLPDVVRLSHNIA